MKSSRLQVDPTFYTSLQMILVVAMRNDYSPVIKLMFPNRDSGVSQREVGVTSLHVPVLALHFGHEPRASCLEEFNFTPRSWGYIHSIANNRIRPSAIFDHFHPFSSPFPKLYITITVHSSGKFKNFRSLKVNVNDVFSNWQAEGWGLLAFDSKFRITKYRL